MAEAYYEPTPATDGATMNPVPGAVFQVFELADTGFTTPLSLRVGSGNPTTTVAASDTLATLPGVYVTSPNFEHIWKSGTFEWRRDSIDGAKKAVEDAKLAASNSASSASSAASEAATSAQAAQDAAALVDAPADTVLADLAGNPASQFAAALSATTAEKISEAVTPLSVAIATQQARQLKELAPTIDFGAATATRAATYETTPTPYFGNELVHPSVIEVPKGFAGYTWWMAITPYENSNDDYENPSVYCSIDGETWITPEGLTNPIDGDPGGSRYNSDPDLVDGEDGHLYLFWRESGGGVASVLYRSRSSDGVNWSDPAQALVGTVGVEDALSPAIVRDGTGWRMYFVNLHGRTIGYKTAATLDGTWGATTTLIQSTGPDASRTWWHIDAVKVGDYTVLIVNDGDVSTSGVNGNLWLLWSATGTATGFNKKKILDRTVGQWDEQLYRASIVPMLTDSGAEFRLYYSAYSTANGWQYGRGTIALPPKAAVPTVSLKAESGNRLVQGIMGIGASVAGDTFNRADAATLGTSSNGQVWEQVSGALSILGNRVKATASGNHKAVIPTVANGHTLMQITTQAAGNAYVVFRYQDESNFWRFGVEGGNLRLQKIVGGATTSFYNAVGTVPAGTILEVSYLDNEIRAYRDGVLIASATDSALSAAIRSGMQITDNGTTFVDSFAVLGR